MLPTPARANREARAEPVAPHPTKTTRAMDSIRCPSGPIPAKSICLEYLSSSSKQVTSAGRTNHYYRGPLGFPSQMQHAVIPDSSNYYQLHSHESSLRLKRAIW